MRENTKLHDNLIKDYLERILLPVFTALTVFPTPTQQVVGRLAVKTLCDSWLEHIYQKKFKFSEQGAKQLSADFAFLRQWVDSSHHLTEDSKRSVGWLVLPEPLQPNNAVQVPAAAGQHPAVRGRGPAAAGRHRRQGCGGQAGPGQQGNTPNMCRNLGHAFSFLPTFQSPCLLVRLAAGGARRGAAGGQLSRQADPGGDTARAVRHQPQGRVQISLMT